jgi:hypothetical protein
MTVVEGPRSAGLVARVQAILLRPKAEWGVIAGETATVQGLFTGYAMILAAIPAIARAVGGLIPICILGVCVRLNPVSVVAGAAVYYVVDLVGVYVIGLAINALAPSFGGTQDQVAAMKVSVYSFTAAWLAGVFAIYPPLGVLGILGLYSLYLLYAGLPKVMKCPEDKALVYTAVSVVIGIVVFIVVGVISGVVSGLGSSMPSVSIH